MLPTVRFYNAVSKPNFRRSHESGDENYLWGKSLSRFAQIALIHMFDDARKLFLGAYHQPTTGRNRASYSTSRNRIWVSLERQLKKRGTQPAPMRCAERAPFDPCFMKSAKGVLKPSQILRHGIRIRGARSRETNPSEFPVPHRSSWPAAKPRRPLPRTADRCRYC